jgi:hypothetical protein
MLAISFTAPADTSQFATDNRVEPVIAAYLARHPGDAMTATDIETASVLQSLPSYTRGALTLALGARNWPAALQKRCGIHTGLVVRLFCADHPTIGRTEDLENAAAERLTRMIGTASDDVVTDFALRALEHFESARAAFVEARHLLRSAAR